MSEKKSPTDIQDQQGKDLEENRKKQKRYWQVETDIKCLEYRMSALEKRVNKLDDPFGQKKADNLICFFAVFPVTLTGIVAIILLLSCPA